MTALEFISSAGLREFLVLLKRMDKKKARPAMFGISQSVEMAFEIAGFNVLFEYAKDRTSAIRAVDRSVTTQPGLLGRLLGRAKPAAS